MSRRTFAGLLGALALAGCCTQGEKVAELSDWPAGTDPVTVSRRLSEQFLRAVPEAYKPVGCDTARASYGGGRAVMYCTASLWAHGLECARLSGDRGLEQKLLDRFWPLLKEKKHLAPAPGHVDNSIFGALPLEVARLTGCPEALKFGLHYADLQWTAPDERTVNPQNFPQEEQMRLFRDGYTPETRFWIDDMYMITFLQVQAYRATGDLKYLSRTAKELALYIGKLQRPDGLFDHASGVQFVWGRGDGWVSGGLTLLLKYLPKDDPSYPAVRAGYEKMMAALLRHQRANGLWGQLVDDAGSWDETSGSAMFAFGFVTGVRLGILDRATYAPAARKAYLALVTRLDAHANLADVCEGTVKKNDRAHYLARPRVNGAPYGQAALMWICNALLD